MKPLSEVYSQGFPIVANSSITEFTGKTLKISLIITVLLIKTRNKYATLRNKLSPMVISPC